MRLFAVPAVCALVCGVLVVGCRNTPGSPPTPVSQPVPGGNVATILGIVTWDTAFRVLPDVGVEVVDGPDAGTRGVSDGDGQLWIAGTSTGTVKVRATKNGYATKMMTLTWQLAGDRSLATVELAPLGPSLNLALGDYTMTVLADPLCTQ